MTESQTASRPTLADARSEVARFSELSRVYTIGRGRRIVALDRVAGEIWSRDYISITGPSGAGKSTMLHLLAALDLPSSGSLRIGGVEMSGSSERTRARIRNATVGVVLQAPHLLADYTAVENVCLPLGWSERLSPTHEQLGLELLASLGIEELADRLPAELSGGQRQRVAVARALVRRPSLVLADEPTGNLDPVAGRSAIEALESATRNVDGALVVVTHSEGIARRAPTRWQIEHGRLFAIDSKGP